jgi:hypothetical protein
MSVPFSRQRSATRDSTTPLTGNCDLRTTTIILGRVAGLDLSLLSVDALDGLLSSESFMVDSEEALLRFLCNFWHPLLCHIRWEFVSAAAIISLCEDPALCYPTESVRLAIADQLSHPPPPRSIP